MGVSYVTRKCNQCAGRLEYLKDKKIWKCLYCGAEIERQEQYDGLFTIKNVVRQSLLDVSYRRLDSALKNIIEAEKIDSHYIGTIIAKIVYEMICAITPGACRESDVRNLLMQLKKNYEALQNISKTITDEEEALYEYLEESDIYATLVLVYDSLSDVVRRDFVFQLVDTKQIYSKDANGNLFTYVLKNENFELVKGLLSNPDNIDVGMAFSEILKRYPDNANKVEIIKNLIKTKQLNYDDKAVLEKYLSSSEDSSDIKAGIIIVALENGMDVSLDFTVKNIFPKIEEDKIKDVFLTYCSKKLSDADIMLAFDYACECKNTNMALCIFDCLKKGNQFVVVPSKTLIAFLSSERSAEDKIKLIEKILEFKIEGKGIEAAVTDYLCYNEDPVNIRQNVITYLFEKVSVIPTNTVQNYILRCEKDGEKKPEIVKAIFKNGINTSFFNDLLSKYINSSIDSEKVKAEITNILTEGGLKIDPDYFEEYICSQDKNPEDKIYFVKKMILNGSRVKSKTANNYLVKNNLNNFSSELFSLIFTPASSFDSKATERYLLLCKDRDAIKAQNFVTIAERCLNGVDSIVCQIEHGGNIISCNLLQAYILLSNDSQGVTSEIVKWFVNKKRMKINAEIECFGRKMKFRKYVVENKTKLSKVSDSVCEQFKVYSMLF